MEENSDRSQDNESYGRRLFKQFSETIDKSCPRWVPITLLLFTVLLFVAAFTSDYGFKPFLSDGSLQKAILAPKKQETSAENYPNITTTDNSFAGECPEYFRWIHEDLRPWSYTGISRERIEASKKYADFRLLVIKGKVYVEKYRGVFQTRDVFTIWGILQLIKYYPGKLPDIDIMFACGDMPMIIKRDHQLPNATSPPAVFHYCADEFSMDIVFPDWSFWGWPEINIKPWVTLRKELEDANNKTEWFKREPYAYWKGNKGTSQARQDLYKCKPTKNKDWKARVFDQNWDHEAKQGYNSSNLADQCIYRYKIFVEGRAWSVSEKYILACDSMSLFVKTHYYDIYTRSLIPLKHYWPIREDTKCKSINFAVDWGNKNTKKAQEIGKEGSKFIVENSKMNNIYDYMFHILNAYAKLLQYEPTIPPGAVEISTETELSTSSGLIKTYKLESMVKEASTTTPCSMPLPYDPITLRAILDRKDKLTKQVEDWEAKGKVN